MKLKHIICTVLAAALTMGLASQAVAKDQKELEKQAKITKEEATKIALEKVPGGTVKESELEEEKGKLIWSFDISKEGTKDITEVNVDAKTGKVIAVDVESAKDEAKEAKEEAKEKKHDKKSKKDDDDDEKDEKK